MYAILKSASTGSFYSSQVSIMASPLAEAQPLKDSTQTAEPQDNPEEAKLSKNKKSLDEGKDAKVLRKKIRHLRREDERQAKSLAQDLKDIRESLSDVNNLKQTQKYESNECKHRRDGRERHYKPSEEKFGENGSARENHQQYKHKAKSTDKTSQGGSSNYVMRASSTTQKQKAVKFEDQLDETKSDDATLSLSSIDLQSR